MKLFHLPNERTPDRNRMELTSRKAFENLLMSGELTDYKVYSFLYESKVKGIDKAENEIIKTVLEMQPDIIYWQHISDFNPSDKFYRKLKKSCSKTFFIYQDEDAYSKFVKPITKEMKRVIRVADLNLTSGTGNFIDHFNDAGSKKTQYFPHCFDSERTPKVWEPEKNRNIPIVMIGSMFHSKIPGKYLPGARKRKKLAINMDKRFGESFYLYGNGWDRYKLSSFRGFLPFYDQFKTLKNSWISVIWDHFDQEPCYSSDRLPITMASGTPHITSWHPGYELMFKNCKGGLYFAKSPKEAVEIATYLLSQPPEFLIDEGKKAFDFIYENYESTKVYKKLIDFLKQEINTNE